MESDQWLNRSNDINDIMEQKTKQILIRVSEADYQLLKDKAIEQDRPIAWVAREYMKQGFETPQWKINAWPRRQTEAKRITKW